MQQLHNTNFLTSSRYASPVLCLLPSCCAYTLCCFVSSFTPFPAPAASPTAFTGRYSSKVDKRSFCKCRVHFWRKKTLSLCEYAHRDGGDSTGMNAPLLHCPIFPYSFSIVWCQDCCEFSHPQDMSYTPAVHLNTGGGGGGGEGVGG